MIFISSLGLGFKRFLKKNNLSDSLIFGLKLDVEIAYNQFGETIQFCNNGDSVVTDGRYQNGTFASGTTLTCTTDNNEVAINSY